ncbi:MAG: AraC family transcriptional regulator, partial [Spirochaetia bacterium]|nr:AraC family transcriptional regulator [Spirochaetia bacterium]
MKHKLSISISVLQSLIHASKNLEIDTARLLADCNLDASILSKPENRFNLNQYDKLIKKAVELSGDNQFGLHLGKAFNVGTGNVVTFMIYNCSNLLEAIKKYIEYQKVVGEAITYEFSILNEQAKISVSLTSDDIQNNRHILEAEIMGIYSIGKDIINGKLKLSEVHFNSDKPEHIDEYVANFQCPIKWNMPESSLIFEKKYLSFPLKQANNSLMTMLESQARSILKRLSGAETYTDKVIKILCENKLSNDLTIESVARKIPISVRGLQMKLKNENTGFQQIFNDIRKQISISHLKENSASITEISYLLGFSDPSSFQKAFKKWTGKSPGKFNLQESSPYPRKQTKLKRLPEVNKRYYL